MRRSATRYVASEKSASVKGRLLPFEFSVTQAYILELGETIMRFYRHQGQILAANITASITNGTFDSGITGWTDSSGGGGGIAHDSTNNRLSLNPGGTAASDIANAEQQVTNSSALAHTIKFRVYGAPGDQIDMQVGTASAGTQILTPVKFKVGFHCYTFTSTAANFFVQFRSLGTYQNKVVGVDDISLIDNAAVEVDTPWSEAQLFQVNGPQSADVLYLYHPDVPTYKLLRLGHASWSLVEVAWEDGPYLPENTSTTTLLPAANTGLGINMTLSAIAGVNDDQGWLATDIGRCIRYAEGGSTAFGWAVIVSITSTTVAVADIKVDFNSSPTAQTTFRLGAWSGTTGYPSIGSFYEQRQWAANTSTQPQTLWATQTADFENHTPDKVDTARTIEDDDALDYTISADEVNAIRWLSPGEDTLVIGTTGGEWIPESNGIVITPSDVVIRRRTTHGSANIQPVRVGNIVLFVQKAKRKIREFGFTFESDGFRAFDMTRLAQHVTRSGVVEMEFQQEPDSVVWAVRSDGQLPSMTFRREEDVVGWARHIIGGTFSAGDAVVESVAVIPGADGSGQVQSSEARDEVWITVKRTIDSATARYIEVFERDYEEGDEPEDAYYADSCITLDTPITITGATVADPVVVTATGHGLSNGNAVRITQVKGMTELNGGSYLVADKTTNTIALCASGDDKAISGATAASPVVITATAHGYSDGDIIGIFDVLGMTELNGITYKVANKATNTFELTDVNDAAINGAAFTAYTSGGKIYHATDGSAFTAYDSAGQVRLKTASISGLGHLEGETVKIWADGFVHPDRTVSSGAITLDNAASVVQIGLGYTHIIKPLKFEGGTRIGTAVGKTKQVFGVTFVLLNSHTLTFGRDTSNLDTIDFRKVSDAMDAGVPLFTGERFVEFDDNWKTDPRIIIQEDAPAPFTLLAMAPEIDTRESRG